MVGLQWPHYSTCSLLQPHSLRKVLVEPNLLHCLFCERAAEMLGFGLGVGLAGESSEGAGHGRGCFLALQLVGYEQEGT